MFFSEIVCFTLSVIGSVSSICYRDATCTYVYEKVFLSSDF